VPETPREHRSHGTATPPHSIGGLAVALSLVGYLRQKALSASRLI